MLNTDFLNDDRCRTCAHASSCNKAAMYDRPTLCQIFTSEDQFSCNGLCHKCTEDTCDNHPKKVKEDLLNYAGSVLLSSQEEVDALEKLWNTKLLLGLQVMLFEDTESYDVRDYELSDEDIRVRDYAQGVITLIQKK
jgi:hypothetical protein